MNKQPQMNVPLIAGLDDLLPDEIAGALEEAGARISVETLTHPSQYPYRPLTVVTAAHSSTMLYLDFLVRCNYLRAVNSEDGEPVAEDSSVGFSVDSAGMGRARMVFEMNCIGTVNARRVLQNGDSSPLEPYELDQIKRYATVGSRPFCEVEGSFIWGVTLGIPLELLGLPHPLPSGQPITLQGNFSKTASATSQPHFLTWAAADTYAPILLE